MKKCWIVLVTALCLTPCLAEIKADAIDAAVKQADIKQVVQSLRDHNRFTREYLIPKFVGLLP